MCNFPARQLFEYAQEVVAIDYSDFAALTYACGLIKSMGELVAYHQDLTGCRCWDKVLAEWSYPASEPPSGSRP